MQRTRAWLNPLRLGEVIWRLWEVEAGNGGDGTWKKDALNNNVRGRPDGGIRWCGNTSKGGDSGTAESEGKASKGGCARGDELLFNTSVPCESWRQSSD